MYTYNVIEGEYMPYNDRQYEFDFTVDVNQKRIVEDLSVEILHMQDHIDRLKSYIRHQDGFISLIMEGIPDEF